MCHVRRSILAVVSAPLLLAALLVTVAAPSTAVPGAGSSVFINEIHYDNTGGDVGEFIEVAGPAGTDLSSWSLVLYNGATNGTYNTLSLSGTLADAGAGYGTSAISLPVNGLQNGSPDGIALVNGGSVVQFLSYEGVFTATDGPAAGQTSTDMGVTEPGTTPVGQSLQLTGTGSTAADFTWVGPAPESPGAVNDGQSFADAPPAGPDVLINEVDADQAGTDAAEFVELTDSGAGNTSLDGLVLVLFNGNGDTAYRTFDLDTQSTGADGYFVLCGNAANVANCDLDVSPDTNLIQNGADAVALYAGDGADFPTGTPVTTDGLIDAVVYDTGDADDAGLIAALLTAGGQVDEGANGDQTGHSNSRCPDGSGDARDTSTYDAVTPSPGAANDCDDGGGGPGDPVPALIHEVQGAGPVAALVGQTVTVEGVVTSLFEDNDALDGFFIQEEDADADLDPATSEGIFVFCRGNCPTGLSVGDQATVTGGVEEFFGMSQVDIGFGSGSATILSSGNPLPTAAPIDLPASGRTDAELTFESIEGMVVTVSDTLVISEYFQLARFGQLVLTADARPEQFTDANTPSVTGYTEFLDDLASRRIILDDNNNDQNDATTAPLDNEPYPWPQGGLSTTNFFRGGDSITNLTGVMHWSFAGSSGTDAWRIRPIDGVDVIFTSENARPSSPADVGGSLNVASFNVLNYFTTLDEPGATCGPSALGCRGAHSVAELERQRDKIVNALAAIDADVVGLIEIENDTGAAVADLLNAVNAVMGAGTYDYVDTGTIGGDAIKVAFIYKPATVTPTGDFAILDSSVDPTFIDTKNRPVLIQTFDEVATGARFTAAVNHLKSKGSPCDDVGDPDLGDGQGNCNQTRTAAALALVNYLATDPTGSGDPDFLIIGDLNAYAMEDPITTLEGAGYSDLIETFSGSSAYSFVFDGQLGYLDHAMANTAMAPQITGVTEWHINADEVPLFDYNDDIQDAAEASFERESSGLPIYQPDAFRSSDHDPLIVGMDLAVQCNGLSATIVGTNGDDVLRGTDGDDVIVSLGGDDRVWGQRGDDVICLGSGDDRAFGNQGNDTIFGEAGDDDLFGNGGDDVLDGGADTDKVQGNGGSDTCVNAESSSSCET